jgi:hypothetical protein
MNSDIRKALQDAETMLAINLRMLASTIAVEQSATDLSEAASGYRRAHPLRSALKSLPASLRPAESKMMLPLIATLAEASPEVRSALAPLLGGRSLSEAEAMQLRSVVVLDLALQNYRETAYVAGADQPLAGLWANKVRAAEDAHNALAPVIRRRKRLSSFPSGIVVASVFLVSAVHLVTSAPEEQLGAVGLFCVAFVAAKAFMLHFHEYREFERPVEWPEALIERAIWAGAVPECLLLLRWCSAGDLHLSDLRAIEESLRLREAMLPEIEDENEGEDDDEEEDEGEPPARNEARSANVARPPVRPMPLSALPPVPE